MQSQDQRAYEKALKDISKAEKSKQKFLNLREELYLNRNQLASLPPEIGNLVELKELSLNNNQLASLPPEIGNLIGLEYLHLSSNQLTSLPPEIGNLVGLKKLYLKGNKLTELPPEIGNLVELEELDLSRNQLTSLPPEIGNLVRIKTLDLGRNKLTELPPEIGKIALLERLLLRWNKLTELPSELDQLLNLKEIEIDDWNPLRGRARDIVAENQKTISNILYGYDNPEVATDIPEENEPEVILLDFEVLPPSFYDEPEYQQTQHNKSGRGSHVAQIDRERLRFIDSLGPNEIYRGSSQFGPDVYHVFVFSNCVVAECPTEGNAIYLLKGVSNWKTLLSIPKLELRQDYANRVQRIMHRGEWKDRLRKAVR